MTPQLAQALRSVAILGAIVRPLLVTTILLGLWLALARAGFPFIRRMSTWTKVAAALIGWLAVVWTLGARGILSPAAGTSQFQAAGMIVVPMITLIVVVLALIVRSPTVTVAIDAAPLWWLIAYQAYRVTGFVFVRAWAQGLLPAYFALPAGIGDTLTGALALLAAVALVRDWSWGTSFTYAVNVFGIVDLLNAATMGVLSELSASTHSPLLLYPLIMVPSFGVPIAFIIHVLSIRQLRRHLRRPEGAALDTSMRTLRTA
jgi:hypothetical protein